MVYLQQRIPVNGATGSGDVCCSPSPWMTINSMTQHKMTLSNQQRDQDFAQLPECADEWLLSRESFVHKFASDARFDDVLLNTFPHFPQRTSGTEATKSSCTPGSCSAACSPPHGKSADSYVSFAKQISQDVETMRAVMRAKQQRILRSFASTAAAGAAGAAGGGVNELEQQECVLGRTEVNRGREWLYDRRWCSGDSVTTCNKRTQAVSTRL
eukprot:TRINITY_DN6012_c0_g1_i1.p2 TRINITY_DN6012_c0_g1~~TRINITY_DN6012_c0_g1_i1.p2  ORF type:complete len:213 (+),score=42.11 TRINITY_DN6012_c0_g1_i1:755-1393(+)